MRIKAKIIYYTLKTNKQNPSTHTINIVSYTLISYLTCRYLFSLIFQSVYLKMYPFPATLDVESLLGHS